MASLEVKEQLKAFRYNIDAWGKTASALRQRAEQVLASGEVDSQELEAVEAGLSRLRAEVSEFDDLVVEVSTVSTEAGSQLAEARETLRLVLLEITELSSAMYSVKSIPVQEL